MVRSIETIKGSVNMKNKKPILVVVQGGGCRQIECATGVMQGLDELGIEVNEYRGASAGGIVPCLHASGLSGKAIANLIAKTPVSELFSFSYLQAFKFIMPFVKVDYMYNTDGLKGFLDLHINCQASHRTMISMTRKKDSYSRMVEGTPLTALASSAIPEVFPPVKVGAELYVDGGVINNIPMPKIKDIENYEHIYIILCNKDTKKNKKSWSKIGRSLKLINDMSEREVHQVYEEGWNELENVTVIQPEPYRSHLLEWTEYNSLISHACEYTKRLITQGI